MLDRSVAPPFNRSIQFDLIQPETTILPNGVQVYFVSGGNQSVVKVELILKAGRWFEQHWGAAYFSSNLLLKGTSQKSSFEIAQLFDLYGAHLEINAGLDVVSVSLYSLTRNLEPALTLLLEILLHSIFPQKELEQSKAIYLQNLKVNYEKTSFIASKIMRKNLFGETHPYGKELEEKEVNELGRDALVNHFNNCFKDVFVIVSGKIEDRSQQLIRSTFSGIPFRPVQERVSAVEEKKPFRQLTDKEGSIQASIRIGRRFISRSHPDYFDALMLNHILGGYFGSRLMKNIREDKGLSYGIYSSIHNLRNNSYVVIGSDVNKKNLDLAFTEIRKEFIRLRTEPISTDELETARNHFIGSLQSEITTSFAHAEKLKNIIIYKLPQQYYQQMINRIAMLTGEDLLKTADLYFHEDSFFEVAVG